VQAWKESGRRALAREAGALVAEVVPRPQADVLVPVPADPERARERGDVPPRRLASELCRAWDVPLLDALERTRSLPHQRGLALAERRRNVRGSVRVRVSEVPRTVCVVDDVYTSGATADACAAVLRKHGARRVSVVTLARAVR
jgi:predicted amidophosphoribosyltransferase